MLDMAQKKAFQQRFDAVRTLEKDAVLSLKESMSASLKDAGKNAVFELNDNTYFVKEFNRYEEASEDFKARMGSFVYELTCLCLETGDTIFLEWEEDDTLEIAVTLDRFSFRNLLDDEGQAIDEDDLDQIADDKDVIVINGEKFWYEDDWASIYHRGEKQEKVYMYEFENEKGSKFLTIEEWQGSGKDEYQIYTSQPVQPDSIRIISKGDH